MAREHVVFKLRITCSDDSVKELVYCKFNCDGIPDSIIQDSVRLSVVSEVEWDDAMLYKKKKRRYKKGINCSSVQLYCREPCIHIQFPLKVESYKAMPQTERSL